MLHWIRRVSGKTVDLTKDPDQREALQAVAHADHVHQGAVDQTGEITVLSNKLRTLRETNHFAELIRSALKNGEASK
jgi:hypothetical protein